MLEPTLIMHTWKTSIMTITSWNIDNVNIIAFMDSEDDFIILNILYDVVRYFKNHFKTFVIKLTNV